MAATAISGFALRELPFYLGLFVDMSLRKEIKKRDPTSSRRVFFQRS